MDLRLLPTQNQSESKSVSNLSSYCFQSNSLSAKHAPRSEEIKSISNGNNLIFTQTYQNVLHLILQLLTQT